MAIVFAYMSPALGHLFPFCALLGELRRRGHEVHVRTSGFGVKLCREQQFDAKPVDRRIEALQTAAATTTVLKSTRDTVRVLTRRAALEVDDFTRAIADVQPDVTIIDANCWGAMSVAETQDRPWVALSPFIPYLRSLGSPPFGAGAKPRTGLSGRIRDLGIAAVTSLVFDQPFRRGLGPVRAGLGLPPVHTADALLRRAPTLLVATAKPFEYRHTDWGDSVELIGPAEFDPPHHGTPTWLANIDIPVVLVTTSSVPQADHALVQTAIEALEDEPVHTVVTAPAMVGAVPKHGPRVTVSRFVPHSLVLDRAVCVITHGGLGITQKALARGIPVCAVPFGRDQFEVARRVEIAGAGTRLPARRLTTERLRDAVRSAMSMSDGAGAIADAFAMAGGVARGATVVEREMRRLAER